MRSSLKKMFKEYYDFRDEIKELVKIEKIDQKKADMLLVEKQYEVFDKIDTKDIIKII